MFVPRRTTISFAAIASLLALAMVAVPAPSGAVTSTHTVKATHNWGVSSAKIVVKASTTKATTTKATTTKATTTKATTTKATTTSTTKVAPAGTVAPKVSAATSVYVATTGVDRVGAGTSGSPYKTIQYAVSKVPSGWAVQVAAGTYAPFSVTTAKVIVIGASRTGVIIRGSSGVQGVVALFGAGDQVSNLTVTGCVPNPKPVGSFEYSGSASVLVRNTALNAVVSNLTIANGHGTNSYGLPFGCYGVYIAAGNGVNVSGNDISGQGDGVFLYRGGQNVKITANVIHDNRYEIRNTTVPNDDFGGTGVDLFSTAGSPGVLVNGNTIYNNFAPSHDYTIDGGAFDLFQASSAVMSSNIIYNNAVVVETGTGASTALCANNVFTANKVSGRSVGSTIPRSDSTGMILRCATNMQITKNTFSAIDLWVFDIQAGGGWAGQLKNLTITGNKVSQGPIKTYALLINPKTVGMTINSNTYTYDTRVGWIGSDWNGKGYPTLSGWRSATGMDTASSVV